MTSIHKKRYNWIKDINWTLEKVEDIVPPSERELPFTNQECFNHCYVCGTFIIEHWFLVPSSEEDKQNFEKMKKNYYIYKTHPELPFLISGCKCGPELLNNTDQIKAHKKHLELQKEKRYERNLKKYKEIVDICTEMIETLPDIPAKDLYGTSAHKRLELIIYKCKVGSFSDYWLEKLNWIRLEYKLKKIGRSK